jgi:hypothetical protein
MKQEKGIRSTTRQGVKVLKDKKSQKEREEVQTVLKVRATNRGKHTK